MRKLHDRFFQQAKREGHLARSIYKLEELDRRFKLLRSGMRVLDLGACPGSWLEHILRRIAPGGVACAVDRNPINARFNGRVEFLQADVLALPADAFSAVAPAFDAVLSDMAPNTSGIKGVDQARSLELCEAAADIALARLAPGGSFVCKIFEGPGLRDFRTRLAGAFREIKVFKPEACREESFETYVVGRDRRKVGP